MTKYGDLIVILDEDEQAIYKLAHGINKLIKKVDKIMTDLSGLQKAVEDVQATDAAAASEIASLAAKVEELSAGDVTQDQIDGIASDLEAAASALAAAGTTTAPPTEETPAEEVPPAEETLPGEVEPPTEPPVEPPAEE